MKKTAITIVLAILATITQAADKKISQYPEATALGTNDLVLISYWNGSGWATNKFVRSTNLFNQIAALGIWTNNSGTIQATSTVTSASGNNAFQLDTGEYLTNETSWLFKISNFTTNHFGVQKLGQINMWKNGAGGFPQLSIDYDGITVARDIGAIYLQNNDDSSDLIFQINDSDSNTWQQKIYQYTSGTNGFQVYAAYQGSRNFTVLDPGGDFGATARYVFNTTDSLASGNLAEWQNNDTNKVWITWDGELHAKDFVMEASAIKTSTNAGHSGAIQAYDDNDATYRTFATLQNGNTPSLTIAPPSGGTVTLQGLLKANDGSSGITTNITAGLVTFTIKNGLITSVSL